MRKLIKFLSPYKSKIALATLFMAVSAICELLLPTIMSNILDKGISNADAANTFPYILKCCGIMLAVAVVSLAAVIAGRYFSDRVTTYFTRDLRVAIFHKVHTMTFEEMGRIGTGGLVSRSTHDVGTLSWVSSMASGSVVIIPLMFFGSVALCLFKSVKLSLIMLAAVPLVIIVVALIGKKITPLWEISDEYCDKQNDIVRERIRGIRVIRAFNREPREHERISEATHIMADNIIRANVTMNIVTPVVSLLLNFAVVLVVWFGGKAIEGRTGLTPGDVFAVTQYILLVLNSLLIASFAIIMFPHAKVAARRVGEVLNAEGQADAIAEENLYFTGKIDFEDVSFCYEGADQPAVSHIDMHIRPGDRISIIGGTGSGKSTIVSLLMSFRQPTSGRVLFDGRDAKTISRKTIRRNMSCALQKSMIYAGTVRENVQMGRMDATEEEIVEALDIAQMRDFIQEQADGMDYVLQQAGSNLSGGQKQRLAIARAIIKDAPIYIFDDSFSALDFLTEAKLRTRLNEKFKGRTQIVITQRVTSAMSSDCIFVLSDGKLVGAGKHAELVKTCDIYREIYASQTGGDLR
ncbi:MAG: ABC transporter ATP-binding protein/permease [Clostridia bacterium]|nr:ABC transporter ATP-binding protein/permease [Clostridia bacterium]